MMMAAIAGFAITGAPAEVKKDVSFFGLLVLGVLTAIGGKRMSNGRTISR